MAKNLFGKTTKIAFAIILLAQFSMAISPKENNTLLGLSKKSLSLTIDELKSNINYSCELLNLPEFSVDSFKIKYGDSSKYGTSSKGNVLQYTFNEKTFLIGGLDKKTNLIQEVLLFMQENIVTQDAENNKKAIMVFVCALAPEIGKSKSQILALNIINETSKHMDKKIAFPTADVIFQAKNTSKFGLSVTAERK